MNATAAALHPRTSLCYGHNGLGFSGPVLSYRANPGFGISPQRPAAPAPLQLCRQGGQPPMRRWP